MNDFYSIGKENEELENSLQLEHLGSQRVIGIVGSYRRSDWGERSGESKSYYAPVTKEDYDGLFASKLVNIRPPYDLHIFLDFHSSYYTKEFGGSQHQFLNHMKYVVLPLIVRRYKNKEEYIELFERWLEEKGIQSKKPMSTITNNIITGDINAPTQFQQNSKKSHQSQEVVYNRNDVKEILELIQKDIQNLGHDIREELSVEVDNALKYLEKGKDVSSRLKTIGSLIKDININVFANLIAAPIFESIRPILGI